MVTLVSDGRSVCLDCLANGSLHKSRFTDNSIYNPCEYNNYESWIKLEMYAPT